MTDLDLHADDLRRALDDLAGTVRPSTDDAWAALLPRLASGGGAPAPAAALDEVAVVDLASVVDLADYAPPAARGLRRRLRALGAVAAAVALVGLGLVVPRLDGSDVAADRAVPYVLLGGDQPRFSLRQADIAPQRQADGHTTVLADPTGTRGYVLQTTVGLSIGVDAVSGPDSGTVTIGTASGQFVGRTLYWTVAGTGVSLSSFGDDVPRDELAALARIVTVASDGRLALGSVPAGLAVTVDGPNDEVVPRAQYTLDYDAEDLDAPYDDTIQIAVATGGRAEVLTALWAAAVDGVTTTAVVRGHEATVMTAAVTGAPETTMIVWEERSGVTVTVVTSGLSTDEALTIARSLRTLDESDWRAALGTAGVAPSGATTATTAPAGVEVASGTATAGAWTLQLLGGAPSAGQVCLQLEAGPFITSGCGPPSGELTVVLGGGSIDTSWLVALVGADVARVRVVDAAGRELVATEPISAGAAGRVVVASYPAPTATGATVVAVDASGREVATVALPGGDGPSAPLPAGSFPDSAAVTAAPSVLEGTFDGRVWRARAAFVPLLSGFDETGSPQATGERRLCAGLDFAARAAVALTCEADGTGIPGVLGLSVTTEPRSFLLALLPAGDGPLVVGWADGTTSEAAVADIPDAGGVRVAVVAVPVGSRIVSLTTSAGRVEVSVPGERGGEVRLPEVTSAAVSGP